MLLSAIILITTALVLYSTGVWAERRAGRLSWGHAGLFAAGLAFDASGTFLMTRIAGRGQPADAAGAASVLNGVMGFTGAIALVLMALHLTWAVVVLLRDRESEKNAFHRLSLGVWGLWLLPYATGALGAAL